MKIIEVEYGEKFQIDSGKYVSIWKLVMHNGILTCERQINTDSAKIDQHIEDCRHD